MVQKAREKGNLVLLLGTIETKETDKGSKELQRSCRLVMTTCELAAIIKRGRERE